MISKRRKIITRTEAGLSGGNISDVQDSNRYLGIPQANGNHDVSGSRITMWKRWNKRNLHGMFHQQMNEIQRNVRRRRQSTRNTTTKNWNSVQEHLCQLQVGYLIVKVKDFTNGSRRTGIRHWGTLDPD